MESTAATPDHISTQLINPEGDRLDYTAVTYKVTEQSLEELERRNLHLLLPFYLLLYRQEVNNPRTKREKRQVLAAQTGTLVAKAEEILRRGCEQGILNNTDGDGTPVSDVYCGTYREFQEERMKLEERLKTHWQDYLYQGQQQGKQQGRQEGEERIIQLLKQGYTLQQIEALRAQEAGQPTTGNCTVQA